MTEDDHQPMTAEQASALSAHSGLAVSTPLASGLA